MALISPLRGNQCTACNSAHGVSWVLILNLILSISLALTVSKSRSLTITLHMTHSRAWSLILAPHVHLVSCVPSALYTSLERTLFLAWALSQWKVHCKSGKFKILGSSFINPFLGVEHEHHHGISGLEWSYPREVLRPISNLAWVCGRPWNTESNPEWHHPIQPHLRHQGRLLHCCLALGASMTLTLYVSLNLAFTVSPP